MQVVRRMIARLIIWSNPIIIPVSAFDVFNWCRFAAHWITPDFCTFALSRF